MRQHNRRLFRVARVILKDDSEAEAALQETYVAAYSTSKTFPADLNLSTWLTGTLVTESFRRLDSQKRGRVVIPFSTAGYRLLETEQAAAVSENQTSSEDATLRA